MKVILGKQFTPALSTAHGRQCQSPSVPAGPGMHAVVSCTTLNAVVNSTNDFAGYNAGGLYASQHKRS